MTQQRGPTFFSIGRPGSPFPAPKLQSHLEINWERCSVASYLWEGPLYRWGWGLVWFVLPPVGKGLLMGLQIPTVQDYGAYFNSPLLGFLYCIRELKAEDNETALPRSREIVQGLKTQYNTRPTSSARHDI